MPTDDALNPTGPTPALGQGRRAAASTARRTVGVPDYLKDTYHWAYLNPLGVRLFDHPFIVRAILWGNYDRLKRAACEEIEPMTDRFDDSDIDAFAARAVSETRHFHSLVSRASA